MATSRSYHPFLIESLKDPQEAAAYLDAVLEDGSSEELRLALRNVAEARLAALGDSKSSISQEIINQISSEQPSLDLSTLLETLDKLGFKLSITLKEQAA
jgi:DNA-binding phage protein